MKIEEKKNFIINVVFGVIIIAFAYLFIKYLLPAFMPFVLAFILAYFAIVMARKLFKKDNATVRTVCLIIVYLIIGIIITTITVVVINKLIEFFTTFPDFYTNGIQPFIVQVKKNLLAISKTMPKDVSVYLTSFIDGVFEAINTIISSISSYFIEMATPIITGAPALLINLMVVIVASFYFIYDYERVIEFIFRIMNEKTKRIFDEVKNYVGNKLIKILWSYIKIMFITFVELAIGLLLFGVDNAIIISMLTALLDILPVLGVGTILIPWGIVDICIGNYFLGIGILVLYTIINLIRNVIEPKMVGDDLGLRPLPTLIAMMIGLNLFGIIGMFGLPLIISFYINRKKKASESIAV